MEITLEKIELVKDRTGVTYAEAKEALEAADGSVVDAIIAIEENINSGDKKKGVAAKGEALVEKVKEQIAKGNVSRIQVKKDDEIVLNLPVSVGIVGVIIAPIASVIGAVVAFGCKCTIEIIKDDGTIIDISDAVTDTIENVAEKGTAAFDAAKGKAGAVADEAKAKYGDKAEELRAKVAEEVEELKNKAAEEVEELKAKAEGLKNKVVSEDEPCEEAAAEGEVCDAEVEAVEEEPCEEEPCEAAEEAEEAPVEE